jgi:hypothetical protein
MAVIVTGVFPNADQADAALRALRDERFDPGQVGIMVPGAPVAAQASAGPASAPRSFDWVPGQQSYDLASVGRVALGGQLAACAASLMTTPSNWLLTEIIECLGIVGEHAEWYADQVRKGFSLVTVQADERTNAAVAIMRRNGSVEVPSDLRTPEAEEASLLPQTPVSTLAGQWHALIGDVRPGWHVYDVTGRDVGAIDEVGANYLLVRHSAHVPYALFVPFDAISAIEPGQAILELPATMIGEQASWRQPPKAPPPAQSAASG